MKHNRVKRIISLFIVLALCVGLLVTGTSLLFSHKTPYETESNLNQESPNDDHSAQSDVPGTPSGTTTPSTPAEPLNLTSTTATSADTSTTPSASTTSGNNLAEPSTSATTSTTSKQSEASRSTSKHSPAKTTKPPATKPKTTTTKTTTTKKQEPATKPPATKPRLKGSVAITFDDGPGPHTARLLDALKKYNAKATFFVLGSKVSANKALIQRMANEGHEVGNHSFSHPDLRKLTDDHVTSQLSRTNKLIAGIIGRNPKVMRPPYGAFNRRVVGLAKQQGLALILWTPSPVDWKYKDSNYVYNYILKHVKAGSTLLLHDVHKTSVDGFIRALPVLLERGLKLVTVSELVNLKPGDVHPSSWYR